MTSQSTPSELAAAAVLARADAYKREHDRIAAESRTTKDSGRKKIQGQLAYHYLTVHQELEKVSRALLVEPPAQS